MSQNLYEIIVLVFSSALLLLSETASTEPVFPSPPVWDASEDTDQDGLRDEDEMLLLDEMLLFGMDPLDPEDGLADDDGDGLTTAEELFYQTDPYLADTDGDTWNDGDELMLHTTDPRDPQSFPQGDGVQNPDTTTESDEVRVGEWANPPEDWPQNKPGIRPNATRFWYFREIFKNLTTP